MNSTFLSLYSNSDLIRLFERQVGWQVDDIYIREFRKWLVGKLPLEKKKILLQDYFIWMIQRAHEYSQIDR